jgi:hypothetical protein
MDRRVNRPAARRGAVVVVLATVLALVGVRIHHSAAATTTSSHPIPSEAPQPGWTVASRSARGVMVDFKMIVVGGAPFRVVRLRARSTFLRWHVGSTDPAGASKVPADAGPRVNWPNEGVAGVVALFNGGFKESAHAGGAVVDGVVLNPLVRGAMTVAINRAGHWEMGVWGASNFPTPSFQPISLRQNLAPLVQHGALSAEASSSNWSAWGAPLNNNPLTARTGLGVDRAGNLIYVASMKGVLAPVVGRALIDAGALAGMQLDINPFWPVEGASFAPVHNVGGTYPVQIPYMMHHPNVYDDGWTRDFFVAMAEPSSWNCSWQSVGVRAGAGVQPQHLRLVGSGCTTVTPSTTTTTTTTSTTTTMTTMTTTTSPS